MGTDFRTLPQLATGTGLRTRNIFTNLSPSQVQQVPSLAIIDGTLSRDTGSTPTNLLRAGLIMGKVTTGGKYRPSILGLVGAAYTSGGTSITVNAAVATEVARLIAVAGGNINLNFIGPPAAAGTVAITTAACSAASGTTLTVASLGVNKAAGSLICPSDGSHLPVTVLPNAAGIDVQDTAGNSLDQALGQFLRGADLLSANIINLTADDFGTSTEASTQAWIKSQLQSSGREFTFDNDR